MTSQPRSEFAALMTTRIDDLKQGLESMNTDSLDEFEDMLLFPGLHFDDDLLLFGAAVLAMTRARLGRAIRRNVIPTAWWLDYSVALCEHISELATGLEASDDIRIIEAAENCAKIAALVDFEASLRFRLVESLEAKE